MSESELGKALLRGESPIDVAALTQRVLRRDRWRMWMLAIGCIVAWMAVVMLPWATILPMLAKVVEHQAAIDRMAGGATPEQRARSLEMLQVVKQGTMATFFGSLASMFVAAVCTVALIVLSRRATLRQVNERLGEIGAHLRRIEERRIGAQRE